MSRLTEKLPVIKQIKQIDYNYKSNIFGGIVEEDKKENAVWLFHNIVEKLADYEDLGSVETIKSKLIEFKYLAKVHAMYDDNKQNFLNNQKLEHELDVYKRALKLAIIYAECGCDFRMPSEEYFLEEARKELEDESM